jgi:hypothetical protein
MECFGGTRKEDRRCQSIKTMILKESCGKAWFFSFAVFYCKHGR